MKRTSERNASGVCVNRWVCACDCGKTKAVRLACLTRGTTRSCGCIKTEQTIKRNTTHGMTKTSRSYVVWSSMRARCEDKSNSNYQRYGGRGITVCERWKKFENFYADMGERPAGMSIERINNDGNYEPGNCRWASRNEQARNRRSTRLISWDGQTMCASDWATKTGISMATIINRVNAGWPIPLALTKKVKGT